jgi:FSR family fosmidomycin resistance protein-like MFS transporter
MTTKTLPLTSGQEARFRTADVLTIASGHFTHDIYTAFIAPLLPLIIERLSLSLALAGGLPAIMRLPALLNPMIGYLGDRAGLRIFVILAPGVTASLITLMGYAPGYSGLLILFLVTGVSAAAFHALAPAMIAALSNHETGKGMSLFMAGGELARTVGPLLAVWAVSTWGLGGLYRVVFIGWASSLVLFWRLRSIPTSTQTRSKGLRLALPTMGILFLPLVGVLFFKTFLSVSLAVYLPTFMNQEGANLWISGGSLSVLELAGVAGALLSGTLSDRLGRKPVLLAAALASSGLLLLFLRVRGWMLVPVLLALGFSAMSTNPVLMATVQDHLPDNRGVGNGVYMTIDFLLQPLAMLLIGFFGDRIGLRTTYIWIAWVSLLSIPAILALPVTKKARQPAS